MEYDLEFDILEEGVMMGEEEDEEEELVDEDVFFEIYEGV